MSADTATNQELTLKKRARRRLVGAIALVLLMLIILPQILQDRAAMQHEAIKITMPDSSDNQITVLPETPPVDVPLPQAEVPASPSVEAVNPSTQTQAQLPSDASLENLIAIKEGEEKQAKPDSPKTSQPIDNNEKIEKKTLNSADNPQKLATDKLESKVEKPVSEEFTVQVGVYSDAGNIKRLQGELKQAGYTTTTEKVVTDKGESVRLKAGKFSSRQEAEKALTKLKSFGLSGIVIHAD